jgi:hypothetical protein
MVLSEQKLQRQALAYRVSGNAIQGMLSRGHATKSAAGSAGCGFVCVHQHYSDNTTKNCLKKQNFTVRKGNNFQILEIKEFPDSRSCTATDRSFSYYKGLKLSRILLSHADPVLARMLAGLICVGSKRRQAQTASAPRISCSFASRKVTDSRLSDLPQPGRDLSRRGEDGNLAACRPKRARVALPHAARFRDKGRTASCIPKARSSAIRLLSSGFPLGDSVR